MYSFVAWISLSLGWNVNKFPSSKNNHDVESGNGDSGPQCQKINTSLQTSTGLITLARGHAPRS